LAVWCLFVSFYYEFPVRPKPRSITLRGAHPERRAPQQSSGQGAGAPLAGTAALLLLLLSAFTLLPLRAQAAAKVTPAAPAPAGAAPAEKPAEPPPLAKIVSRLSAAENRTARDWAELGRETVTWGSRIRSEQKPVPEGPVRDALGAADLGERLDAKAADWPKLRQELEALLQQPDEDKQQKKKDKKQPEDRDQQKKDKKDQDQNQDQQEKPDQSQDQKSEEKSQQDPSDSKQQKEPGEKSDPGESAFGDMQKKEEPPPPPPENTQQVGGKPEKPEDEAKEQMNPALALPLQKLEQLRNQDSPAQLFQLMDGNKKSEMKPGPKSGKNW
jgi:Ca-activated chloride channel family protein